MFSYHQYNEVETPKNQGNQWRVQSKVTLNISSALVAISGQKRFLLASALLFFWGSHTKNQIARLSHSVSPTVAQ